jgi:hypothetical protein
LVTQRLALTWAFSWLGLQDRRPNYQAIRKQVPEYHHSYDDEITFIPRGSFAPMYNRREQVNRDLHDARDATTPEGCRGAADFMIKEVHEWTPTTRPAFLHIFLGNWLKSLDVLELVVNGLGSDYVCVRPDQLPRLYRAAQST